MKYINGQIYHLYNRGVDKRDIFLCLIDYVRFVKSLKDFNNLIPIRNGSTVLKTVEPLSGDTDSELVEIIAYCLNPNHFHLIVKQLKDNGIPEFMKRLSGGYTCYFNKKYSRTGSLFGGRYKGVFLDSPEYVLLLSAYVNCNNFIHGLSKSPSDWQFSSYLDYVGYRDGRLCSKNFIYNQLGSENLEEKQNFYKNFCFKEAIKLKEDKKIKKYFFE